MAFVDLPILSNARGADVRMSISKYAQCKASTVEIRLSEQASKVTGFAPGTRVRLLRGVREDQGTMLIMPVGEKLEGSVRVLSREKVGGAQFRFPRSGELEKLLPERLASRDIYVVEMARERLVIRLPHVFQAERPK